MRFARDVGHHLKRECNANEWTSELWKESVIVSLSTSQSVSLFRESHARNDGEVYFPVVGEEASFRLLYAI